MKKFLTLVVALVTVIPMMAIGRNDGSTKANAIDFDWEAPMTHDPSTGAGATKWYRVDLAPLYEEESPALNLFLANKDAFNDTHTSLKATVAGQTDEKSFTIHPKQQRVWSANATMLIRLKQKEIYLTLTSDGPVMMSARVFEAQDLDETCTDAFIYNWSTGITKPAGVPVWYKLNIREAREKDSLDVCVVVANNGTSKLTLYAGQSLDCPSSGVTKRTIELAAGDTLRDTIPNSMLKSVAFDELYVSLENDQPITVKTEYAKRPPVPVMPNDVGQYVEKIVPDTSLHKYDTTILQAGVTYYFKYDVTKLNSLKKYEPEFTFRNAGTELAKVDRKMAFELPAHVAQGNVLELDADAESIEVIAKNTLLAMDNSFVYVKMKSDKDVQLISRFKHIREGKACKTNIDYNWLAGHRQEAKTTQWYAVDVADARDNMKDIIVNVVNQGSGSASFTASLAFSCPYIDLQEISKTIKNVGDTLSRRISYSTYAMMPDTVWVGLATDQDIRFWVDTVDVQVKAVVDSACMNALPFNWKEGVTVKADTTVWYKIDIAAVREMAAKFPTIFIQNLSSTETVTIEAEQSVECPDSIENQKRTYTIEANGSYSKQISRNMFENIVSDEIYLRLKATQDISLQIRLTEEAEGASCSSAIPFNWTSGNTQAADANLWYAVDLRGVMKGGNDIRIHMQNKDNVQCKGLAQLLYECPTNEPPSVQSFKLSGLGKHSITVQNSAFEMVEDSMAYFNLQGNTSLRVWAEILPVASFDTIFADGLTLIPLQWDSLYTQTTDTAWYIIPKSEIDYVRNLDEKVKPVAHLINLGTSENTIKGEAAFAFPIGKKMMTKSQKVAAGKPFRDTIPAGTFDQLLKKDSIILRITRPIGSADFQFRAELVKAFSGNKREDALPIRLGQSYTQSPNTEMWYKVNTVDLKKDTTLYNKVLWVNARNAGAGDAEVTASVYEGLMSEIDLLEEYGLNDYRKRTVKKGEGKTHNVPAQVIYAVGDIELYIKLRTTDSLVFETKFNGTYAPQAVDPKQAEATLVVPNVEYTIPANEEKWYMVCIPYIQNNYIYTEGSTLEYELNGKATIEVTATFQDQMNCAMPVRKRTINKSGKAYNGTKPLRELIELATKKAGHPFDFSGTAPEFMDSLLHRFITKDSVTFYVRIKSDKQLKAKLNTPQTTGHACDTAMMFDWEHGNVNAAGTTTWYQVNLDSVAIPDSCDLRLHVDNWAADSAKVSAEVYFDCNDPATKSKTYKQGAYGKDTLDIDRDFLRQIGWPAYMIIKYNSDSASHIWAELIPNKPRECDYDTVRDYLCQDSLYLDTITNLKHGPITATMIWNDTVEWQDGVTMRDSVTTFIIRPLLKPEALTVDSMKKLGAAPLLVQGMQLFVDSSSVKLTEYYRNLGNTVDTIAEVDTAYWAKPVYVGGVLDNTTDAALDLTSYYTKNDSTDALLLVIKGAGCGFTYRQDVVFSIDEYKYAPKNDTVCPPMPAVNPDTMSYTTTVIDTLGLPRYVDTVVTYYVRVAPTLYTKDQLTLLPAVANDVAIDTTYTIGSLFQQFEADATDLTMAVTDIKWKVYDDNKGWVDMPYTVPHKATLVRMRYDVTTECDTTLHKVINFDLVPPCDDDTIQETPVTVCDSYTWHGNTYTTSGVYYFDNGLIDPTKTCHQYLELNLTILQSTDSTLAPVTACDSYYWALKDTTITTSGAYTYVTANAAGCDSVITLNVTINYSNTGEETVTACDSYTWQGNTYTTSGDYQATLTNVAGCDSVATLHLTVNYSTSSTETPVTACDEYYWASADTTIKATGTYTHVFKTVLGCDSVVTLSATINNSIVMPDILVSECNMYQWKDEAQGFDTLITTTGKYTHVFTTALGCDSTVTIDATIDIPYLTTLSIKSYYGDRIIMIDRNEINAIPGWHLDSLDIDHPEYVEWHEIDLAGIDTVVATGYYYTLPNGDPLPSGYTYYAVVNIPASVAATCGALGTTAQYTVPAHAAAPALVPSLARPGEDIQVINLDPEVETIIRIYTAEGLLHKTYTSYGETTFTIKAANDNGFYIVELSADSMKSTLRYIVK